MAAAAAKYGQDKDYWHKLSKKTHLGYEEFAHAGEVYLILHSTAKLSKKQMTEYMEAVEIWLHEEHGVSLPEMAA